MNDWYDPPCSEADKLSQQLCSYLVTDDISLALLLESNDATEAHVSIPYEAVPDQVFVLTHYVTHPNVSNNNNTMSSNIPNCDAHFKLRSYCSNVDETLWSTMERNPNFTTSVHQVMTPPEGHHRTNNTSASSAVSVTVTHPPIFLQLGDENNMVVSDSKQPYQANWPVWKKFRPRVMIMIHRGDVLAHLHDNSAAARTNYDSVETQHGPALQQAWALVEIRRTVAEQDWSCHFSG